ncbi:MAG: lipopolysaccharide biosynthesis protein [Scrofimicrobium sp.]
MTDRIGKQVRRDYVWNTASSVMAAASTLIMTLAVTRVSGVALAGLFALGTKIGQQFQSLGMYEVRPYQATDVRNRFSFGTYHSVRIYTVLFMLVCVVLYPVITNQPREDLVLIILVAALRLIDAFEDVFFGEFQRRDRLDLGGKAYFFRVFTTTLVFCLVLVLTEDVWTTTLVTLAVSVISMVTMVIIPASRHFDIRPLFAVRPGVQVLKECLPLALAAFLAVYLSNAPTFAIGSYMDADALGFFAIIFMPAFAVNLLSTLMFRPLLTRLAVVWVGRDRAGFARLVLLGVAGAVAGSVLVLLVTLLVGVPLLNVLSSVDIGPYKADMLVLVVGGSFNAIGVVLYYGLTTMRQQKAVFVGYVASALAVFFLSTVLVQSHGVMGASLAYAGAMLILVAIFAAFLLYFLRRDRALESGSIDDTATN